jgi:hypothetical protein
LLNRASLDPEKTIPPLLLKLLREVPVPALQTVLSQPTLEKHGFGLTKSNVAKMWDAEDAGTLRVVVEGMSLLTPEGGRMEGSQALSIWGAEHLNELWNSLGYPLLSGAEVSRELLREAAAANPALVGMIRKNVEEAKARERDGLEMKSRAFVRILVGVWNEETEWPQRLFAIFKPKFAEATPTETVLDTFLLPSVENLTPGRARTAIDAICALMKVHRGHVHNDDGTVYSTALVEQLLRFADAGYVYLLRAVDNGISTIEDAERDAQTGNGSFMITPGAGVFVGLAKYAMDEIRAGKEEAEVLIRLQCLLDAAVEVTVPEGSGTILDFWEIEDAGRVIEFATPFDVNVSEVEKVAGKMVRNAALEILKRDRASHEQFRARHGQNPDIEPPSPRLQELFSPLRENFEADEGPQTVWSKAVGGEGREGEGRREILLEGGLEVRRIVVWGDTTVKGGLSKGRGHVYL